MKPSVKRPIAIIVILCVSLIAGFIINSAWNFLEKLMNPQDYPELVTKYASEYGIPEYVVYAVIKVESHFDPNALSSAGARGMMQMLPSTFDWLTSSEHLGEHLSANDLYDPDVSIRYGTYYLKYLYSKFNYNWDTALAAYNGGEGNVAKWLADPKYSDGNGNITDFPDDFDETRNYVKKVNDAIRSYKKLYY